MALIRWRDPELAFRTELDKLFDTFFDGNSREAGALVPIDVVEEKDSYTVKMELPGVQPKDVSVTVDSGVLTLRGEKRKEVEEKGKTFHRVERSYGEFQRSLVLPSVVEGSKVDATYVNGVLCVKLAKREEAKPKVIEVKVAATPVLAAKA